MKKRIIPCLDVRNGRTVKGTNFVNLRDAGDPVELAVQYSEQGADELVFLDTSATVEERKTLGALVKAIAEHINIPFTVGGGIRTVEDAKALIDAGADKVSINSAAVKNPELITAIANRLGNQCLVVAIDSKVEDSGKSKVYVHGGRTATELETVAWARRAEERGAGEILLTSMDHDGTKNGFALDLTGTIARSVNIPVIASGGAGTIGHFAEVFDQTDASAALAASIFHFQEIAIPKLKHELRTQHIAIR